MKLFIGKPGFATPRSIRGSKPNIIPIWSVANLTKETKSVFVGSAVKRIKNRDRSED